MADRFVAASAGRLFDLLVAQFPTWSRNTLRQRLQLGCITVDDTVAARHDQPVAAGCVVVVLAKGESARPQRGGGLTLLHVDDDLVAIDKPTGLLSVSTDDERERTALAMLRAQLPPTREGPWPAHRIDRETSGVLLFARSRAMRDAVQAAWGDVDKVYVAIVEGHPDPAEGVIDRPLWEDATLRVRVGEHPDARPARTRYRTLERGPARALLEVGLDTGRKHQIRAHLAWLGHPIVGDDRYGTRGPRLCLHAHRLTLCHPRDGSQLVVEAPVPRELAVALAAR